MEATALEIERRLVVADTRVVAIPAVHIRAAATLAGMPRSGDLHHTSEYRGVLQR
jgi:hypothetical protein